MLPAKPDADAPESERKVFAAFERQLPRDWTVFHSRRVVLPRQGSGLVVERELDFLVIDPARGLRAVWSGLSYRWSAASCSFRRAAFCQLVMTA